MVAVEGPTFSHLRHFRFTAKLIDESRQDGVPVFCQVKVNETDERIALPLDSSGDGERSVKYLLDLYQSPTTVINELPGKNNVAKRLKSEGTRINNHPKSFDLYQLRDAVFWARSDTCD